MSPADRKADRHSGKLRAVRFSDSEWSALGEVAEELGASRAALLREHGLYLIGEQDGPRVRPETTS